MSLIKVTKTTYFNKWFTKLKNRKTQAVIGIHIKRIENDNLGVVRSVGQGVYEKKINYGPGYRLYYVQRSEAWILLLGGGNKSTQKQDINLAQELKKGLK
jgi:putative addiction module killer protein